MRRPSRLLRDLPIPWDLIEIGRGEVKNVKGEPMPRRRPSTSTSVRFGLDAAQVRGCDAAGGRQTAGSLP